GTRDNSCSYSYSCSCSCSCSCSEFLLPNQRSRSRNRSQNRQQTIHFPNAMRLVVPSVAEFSNPISFAGQYVLGPTVQAVQGRLQFPIHLSDGSDHIVLNALRQFR